MIPPVSRCGNRNAGINLTGYHPLGHPGPFAPKCVPSPRALQNRKCSGAGPINDDVPCTGHLHQLAFKHENCQHSHLGLKIRLCECCRRPGKVHKTENNMSELLICSWPINYPYHQCSHNRLWPQYPSEVLRWPFYR